MNINHFVPYLDFPRHSDTDTQRRATVLYGLSITIGAAGLIGFLGVIFVFEEKLISTIALSIFLITGISAFFLSKTRYVNLTSVALLTLIWLTTTGLVAQSGGMHSLDITFYVTGTAVAGFLLGQRGAVFYGGLSILMGFVFLLLDSSGITLPNRFAFPAGTGLVLLLINLVVLVPALNTTLNTLHQAIEQANRQLATQEQTEAELRISERKFSKVFHASPMAIIIQRASDLRYVDVNEHFTTITGYSREDALEHTLNELNLYPDKEISKRMGEQFLAQGTLRNFEIPFRRKDGTIGYGLVWGDIVEIHGEVMYIAGTIDITDRKQYEMWQAEQTHEITMLYEALFDMTATPANLKTLSQQIAATIVSRFLAHKGAVWLLSEDQQKLTRIAYSGPGIVENVGDISVDSPGLVTLALNTKETIYVPDVLAEPRYQAKDETTRSEFVVPLQVYGQLFGIVNMESPELDGFSERTRRLVTAFSRNATLALQNAKLVDSLETTIADLKETQARINFFLEHTSEGVYRLDFDPPIPTHLPFAEQYRLSVEHGKIGECNDAIARMYGFASREEMLGKPYNIFYGKDEYEANLEVNLDFYHQGYKVDNIETEELSTTGEKVYFLNNVVGIIRHGHFVATWGTQRDITPLKRVIAELEERNAELDRFNYTLSHELKTPLITMRGFLGFLEKNIDAGNVERARVDLARIEKATDRMHETINNLLELARIGRLNNPREDVPFAVIVQEGLEIVIATSDESNVQVHVAQNLPLVHVDRVRFVEVIQNLVDNAIKYMGNQKEPILSIGVRSVNNDLVFFVRDNGMGIDPAYHERVFNLFEKLDPNSEGTGIGLTLVKRIIETHGGRIWVESEGLGYGTTFCFTLPLVQATNTR